MTLVRPMLGRRPPPPRLLRTALGILRPRGLIGFAQPLRQCLMVHVDAIEIAMVDDRGRLLVGKAISTGKSVLLDQRVPR